MSIANISYDRRDRKHFIPFKVVPEWDPYAMWYSFGINVRSHWMCWHAFRMAIMRIRNQTSCVLCIRERQHNYTTDSGMNECIRVLFNKNSNWKRLVVREDFVWAGFTISVWGHCSQAQITQMRLPDVLSLNPHSILVQNGCKTISFALILCGAKTSPQTVRRSESLWLRAMIVNNSHTYRVEFAKARFAHSRFAWMFWLTGWLAGWWPNRCVVAFCYIAPEPPNGRKTARAAFALSFYVIIVRCGGAA